MVYWFLKRNQCGYDIGNASHTKSMSVQQRQWSHLGSYVFWNHFARSVCVVYWFAFSCRWLLGSRFVTRRFALFVSVVLMFAWSCRWLALQDQMSAASCCMWQRAAAPPPEPPIIDLTTSSSYDSRIQLISWISCIEMIGRLQVPIGPYRISGIG